MWELAAYSLIHWGRTRQLEEGEQLRPGPTVAWLWQRNSHTQQHGRCCGLSFCAQYRTSLKLQGETRVSGHIAGTGKVETQGPV